MMRTCLPYVMLSALPMVLVAHASAAASSPDEEAIRLASDKAALAEIVVPDEPGPGEQYAARELSDYLYRISGARFSILPESQTSQRPRLFVGRTRAAAPALADLRGADVDSFAVRRVGRDILLVGISERATLYAVYDLLERDLGCRWLAPGKAWEEVPEKLQLGLSPTNRIERPGLRYRFERMTYLPTSGAREKECLVWAVRQRFNVGCEWPPIAAAGETLAPYGGFRGFMWPHSLPHLTDVEKLCREHPDWFALVNGQRRLGEPKNVNLCTSNPEVIAFMANLLSDAFKTQPQIEFLPLGPGDGTGFCQCDRCRALDTGGAWSHLDGVQRPALSDRWMTFVNAVADKVAVTNPGKKIYSLAYHQTFSPPLKVRPRPNVMMMVVNSRPEGLCFVHSVETPGCANNALFCRNFKGWSAITPAGMMAYQYMPHSTFCVMPLPAPHKFIADIRWLAQAGCIGYEGQSGHNTFGLFGITLYAVAKALWNPQINPDALLQDYCNAAFHEAGETMQSFFRTFALGQREAEHTSTGVWTALTPTILKQACQQMDQAQAQAREQKIKRRLAALDAHLRYAEQSRRVYDLTQEAARKRDRQLLDQAAQLARQAEARYRAAAKANPEYADLDLPPRSLNSVLRSAQAAIGAPAKKANARTPSAGGGAVP
jgi:hypothetical protein